jgi:tRNA threonylcarbamoyladenosine biosynthesis protein TsaB
MMVLSLDTTTRGGSCALARDGVVVRERAGDASQPHDARLPHDLMTLLSDAQVALDEIDVYAVATGPGSFTGLRIGIAAMQGLAFAAGKPLIGISAFDALAHRAGAAAATPARIATWIDAWRGEVYAALYEDGGEIEAPTVERVDAVLARLRQAPTPLLLIGDAAAIYRDTIINVLGDSVRIAEPAAPLLAGTIARLAMKPARAGQLPPPHAIRPLYVRRPDAELARDARPFC